MSILEVEKPTLATRPIDREPPTAGANRAALAAVLVGDSPSIRALRDDIERVANTDASVLVLGESGSGKEVVARALHDRSARRCGPFVAVNCGAIAPGVIEAELFGHERGSFTGAHELHIGLFERASAGTLFLDEISEMPRDLQVRLLRVLESRVFQRVGGTDSVSTNARIVAASHRDLGAATRAGTFREDLLYRLAVVPLHVPPLRDRGDDIVILASHFVGQLNARSPGPKRLSRHALEQLRSWPCPGNVRELRNMLHRAYILAPAETIEVDAFINPPNDLKPRLCGDHLEIAIGTTLESAQRELIAATLAHFDGDKPRAAAALGVSLKTLYNRLDQDRVAEPTSPPSTAR